MMPPEDGSSSAMLGIDLEETPTDRAPPSEVVAPQTVAQLGELVRDWLAEAEQRVAYELTAMRKKLDLIEKLLLSVEKKLDSIPVIVEKLQTTATDVIATRAAQGDVALKQHDTLIRLEALERRLNANGETRK